MPLPPPQTAYPITLPDGSAHDGTVLLSAVVTHPRFVVGDHTYASDFAPPQDWAQHLAPYLFPFSQETLTIGKFCQIAHGVRFITASANHAQDGLSCYPFAIFGETVPEGYQPDKRDTVIGHDVWLGYGAMVLPGAQIGHGAIIGAGAVVRGTVPPYGIVTGNPGTLTRKRFGEATIARLLSLAWWDWPLERIERAIPAIMAGDLDRLQALRPD
ncbi:CatB-related O-acetyltransferase [Shimia marina]|uniref:Chloramphenicol acetyltransferase n=1 Tax=Shimia marina TaxID=321267 RepID=A0A0P1FDU0_9RHOB|nr:CatB-related O-acetyltransferase [Shimia marina]CUH52879.1 Chloramphenicol acetyltransferase [Shimia marina]SFD89409.1 virginiamycin A acetyltransferase [Shimia marina]